MSASRPVQAKSAPSPTGNVIVSCGVAAFGGDVMTLWLRAFGAVRLAGLALLLQITDAAAAELKILTPRSMWTVLREIGPQFERSSSTRLNVVTGIAATLADRIIAGENFDVFIGPPVQMDRVARNNKVMADTRTA